jgi:hypothetical protein
MKSLPKHVLVWVGNYSASVYIVGGIYAIREAECAWVVDQLHERWVDMFAPIQTT